MFYFLYCLWRIRKATWDLSHIDFTECMGVEIDE